MSDAVVEYQILEFKVVGSDIVCFRLEDGTLVKAKVIMTQAGVCKSKPGLYQISIAQPVLTIIPKDKKFFGPLPPGPPLPNMLPQDRRSTAQ
jgi:hypothetical protein